MSEAEEIADRLILNNVGLDHKVINMQAFSRDLARALRRNEHSTPERLAYWYFRLNGFLLLENFVIHPDRGSEQRTEADLVGVRFSHRRELLDSPMEDDPAVVDCPTFCNVIVAEVKRTSCALNGPWTNPKHGNMRRFLRAVGCFDENTIKVAAQALYNRGHFEGPSVTCRLLACGNSEGPLPISAVPQILFRHMVKFIHSRLRTYLEQKSSVANWAHDGRHLRNLADRFRDLPDFDHAVRNHFGLPPA